MVFLDIFQRITLIEIHAMSFLFFIFCSVGSVISIGPHHVSDTIPDYSDSLLLLLADQQQSLESEAILINEQDRSVLTSVGHASPLYAEKDVFYQMASFQFSAFRFRPRGYDASFHQVLINGLNMNSLDDGSPTWSLWSGLQSVMKNTIEYLPFRFQDSWMSSAGNITYSDMRASSQRQQLQWVYGLSNRTYTHRHQLSYTTATNHRGWAFSGTVNMRSAKESWNIGTPYSSIGYYFAADKQLARNHVLSYLLFGNQTQYGKQAAITMPVVHLFGNRYNPHWGYQQGMKRNAANTYQHKPVMIIMHEWQPNNHSSWRSSVGFITGKRSDTGLDWFQATDPRPDYYRYLPEYQTDSVLREMVRTTLQEEISLQQIDWEKLYTTNRNSVDQINNANGFVGNTISGKRARYLLEKRIKASNVFLIASNYQNRISPKWQIAAGIQIRVQRNHHYKIVDDLLGADFHVNHNQFAESDFPTDRSILQYNLDQPDQIVYTGDRYGFDYQMLYSAADGWMQVETKGRKTDWIAGIHLSKQTFFRKGMIRNGLFPDNSKGNSKTDHFFNPTIKLGFTRKFSAYQSLLFSVVVASRAPLADNIYVSPRMRNTKQDSIFSEKIITGEWTYRWVSKKFHVRCSAYYTLIQDAMNILTFYHDGYRNFVNYAIRDIDRRHMGIEAGMAYMHNEHWQIDIAAAVGDHRYTSRQKVTVSLDNNEFLLDKMDVYSKHFRVAGTPQMVIGSGIQYRDNRAFFIRLNWSYFDQRWLEFNPVRRTYNALQGVVYRSDLWKSIIEQTPLPSVVAVNAFIGKGFSIKTGSSGKYLRYFCSFSIQNLLNEQGVISGGYEQLRFDQETKNVDRFPPKFFFAPGLNYSASISMNL